jgi:hypothetical protein
MPYQDTPRFQGQPIEETPAWERRRDESPRAYEAFQLYVHSTTRRLAEVAAALVPACSVPNVARWSSRHQWQDRAWQWDKEQDELQQAQEARDRSAARKRHLQIAMTMQEVAVHGLLEMKAKIASGAPLNLTATEIENLMTEAVKLERLVLGVEKDRRTYTSINAIFAESPAEPDEADLPEKDEQELLLEGDPNFPAVKVNGGLEQ